ARDPRLSRAGRKRTETRHPNQWANLAGYNREPNLEYTCSTLSRPRKTSNSKHQTSNILNVFLRRQRVGIFATRAQKTPARSRLSHFRSSWERESGRCRPAGCGFEQDHAGESFARDSAH